MRKIEKQMIEVITLFKEQAQKPFFNSNLKWYMGNTQVTCNRREDDKIVTTVYLHENMIAQYSGDAWGFKMAGWPTPTTKSRINALSQAFGRDGVYTKKGKHYSSDTEVNACDWF